MSTPVPPDVPSIGRRGGVPPPGDGAVDLASRRLDSFAAADASSLPTTPPHPRTIRKVDLGGVDRPARLQGRTRGGTRPRAATAPNNGVRERRAGRHSVGPSDSAPPPPALAGSRPPRRSHVPPPTRGPSAPGLRASRPDPSRYDGHAFQHPADAMRCTVRTIDSSRRSAFDTRVPPSSGSAALRCMLGEMDRVRGSRAALSSQGGDAALGIGDVRRPSDNPCRISPSPGGAALLEIVHGGGAGETPRRGGVARQLRWNPACGAEADPWFDRSYARDAAATGGRRRRRPLTARGDGRYVPVDPATAVRSSLPDHSPVLTTSKRRLPMRSDVGFANPTPAEVAMKMEEVKREAQWEEASPRIILLASGFALFAGGEEEADALHPSCAAESLLWAGGSIPGIPFAGRELVSAHSAARGGRDDGLGVDAGDAGPLPNPRAYSALAPPVDAAFSASHLWRPRPFADRPPGHVYFLACPLDVRLEGGDAEPLFCTMALYSLPEDGGGEAFVGKVSEDFFFPAGNWSRIEGDVRPDDDDEERPQSWRRRKRRAVMAYDPLEVSPEDLHLLIQVFRSAAPIDEGGTRTESAIGQRKTLGGKIRLNLLAAKSGNGKASLGNAPALVEEAGARHLSPVCFGVSPAFAADKRRMREWAPLRPFPDVPEPHDDFVGRLMSLARARQAGGPSGAVVGRTDIFTWRLGGDFTRSLLDEPPELRGDDEADGDADDDPAPPSGPQLLADVMGDRAIGHDGLSPGGPAGGRRSGLRRLPQSRESGYASSFDLREVLYLPPRSPPRKYEEDAATCSATLLNLLYAYPRLIRWNPAGATGGGPRAGEHVSLRVQVVEQELSPDHSCDDADAMYHALHSIYNPTSPAGPPLVESFFTKLVRWQVDSRVDKRDGRAKKGRMEVPLKDEAKIRLPDILDRRHFLQFSLFSIRTDVGVDLLAETTIPFIISSKESTSGGRVTTIIPNGLHRIQLGDGLQIHIETRLASSVHVSDPSIAILLRDYPIAHRPGGNGGNGEDPGGPGGNVIVHASSGFPFLDILTMASGQAVKRHFLSLITANMLNFVRRDFPPFYFESLHGSDSAWHRLVAWDKTDQLLAILRSIFEILDKTRTSYQERDHSTLSLQYQRLIKSFLDTFDEAHRLDSVTHATESSDHGSERQFDESMDTNHTFNDGAYYDDSPSALNDLEREQVTRMPKYQIKSPRNNFSPRVFSRRAFVATRSEQMRAEAEENDNDVYRREYFDDDETIVTLGTISSRMDSASVFPVILESRSFATTENQESILPSKSSTLGVQENATRDWTCGSGIARTPRRSLPKVGSSTPFSFASKRAEFVATRVNNMAQMVIAPCMAPSVDEIMDGGGASGRSPANGLVTGKVTGYRGAGKENPFEPSSDAEEEGEKRGVPPYLRGNQLCLKIPPLTFQLMKDSNEKNLQSITPHLYEVVIALWVQAWTSYSASMKSSHSCQVHGSSSVIPTWPFELVQGSHNLSSDAAVAFSFIRHMSFFLPLCLKSIALRCAPLETTKLIVPMTFLDENHMQILVPFIETIALGLMREAMSGSSGVANSDQMLMKALSNSECVLDFIIGLFALLHPSQVATLLFAYFNILEDTEGPVEGQDVPENMKKTSLRRKKCARQIRLHAVERLAAMPAFARLNFPLKFTGFYPRKKAISSSWANQVTDSETEDSVIHKYWKDVQRFPLPFWLAEMLMNQCLSICNSSCDMIITEAKRQSKAMKSGRKAEKALLRDDLLRMESLAFHSILCAYELLIKRHAMDSRFQSVASSTRVAALFTRVIMQQSVITVSRLARMDPDQKVRLIWILALLYILQEGPDALIRDELRKFCNPEDNRINNFVHMLKLASTSCQYFIPGNESLPALSGLSKELTQEAFNCLSASVILLIDECIGVVSQEEHRLEQFGASVFDLLLHLLASPQSSVGMLRTLGGSAHALDKFGVVIFLKVVELQHWGRIILTMMNSKELSVRSMAVDLLISLLCDVYNDRGSIDSVSLCVMSVLPEVIAREIALYSISGLVKSVKEVETSVWPLRRALADVEEANPLDDDRVDEELLPSLTTFCRTGQAIIDGVLVEIRLTGGHNFDLSHVTKAQYFSPTSGFRLVQDLPASTVFDADEESCFEAASFFSHESSLTQKLRWLYALRDLHVAKKQWSEVAHVLIESIHVLIKSIDHVAAMWRPSQFALWNDSQNSPWLLSVSTSEQVMDFANAFLDPGVLIHREDQKECVCLTLMSLLDQAELAYAKEEGMEDMACFHLEDLLNVVSSAISKESMRCHTETFAGLRHVRASICSKLAKFTGDGVSTGLEVFVRVILHGNKPERFKESTTIPTYFEWDVPSICRVSKPVLSAATLMKQEKQTESWEECICLSFAKPLIESLCNDNDNHSIEIITKGHQATSTTETKTYISIMVVQKKSSIKSRKFFVRHGHDVITEYTVAHKLPYVVSRQRSLITSEIRMSSRQT